MDSHRRCLLICMILFYQKSNMDASIETNKTLTLTWPENETRVYLFTCNQQRPNTLSFVEEIHQRIKHISWICLTFILTYRKEEIHFVLVKFGKEERNKYIIVQKTAISFYKYIFQAPCRACSSHFYKIMSHQHVLIISNPSFQPISMQHEGKVNIKSISGLSCILSS